MTDAGGSPDASGTDSSPASDATGEVAVLVSHTENRRHLERWLREESSYTPVVVRDPETTLAGDLCLVDRESLARHTERIEAWKARERPRSYPVLLVTAEADRVLEERHCEIVDETISMPITLPELRRRIGNLVERRRLSTELATQLEQTETRYETIFSAVNDAILIIDPAADRIVECNPRATELLGYAPEELESLSPESGLHGDNWGAYRTFVNRVLSDGRAWTDSLRCTRKDGTVIETEISASVLDGDADEPNVVFSIRDVTARRDHEREIERNRDRLAELTRITRTLQETTAAVVQASDRDELEARVCERLADSESYQFAWIGERSDESDEVIPRAMGGDADEYLRQVEITVDDAPTGQGPTARALRTHRVAVAQNVAEDPSMVPWRAPLRAFDVRATAAVPITHDGRLFGVLNLYTDRESAFEADERDILADLGRSIGRAITGIRAREEAELFEQAIEHTGHAIYLTDTDGTIQYVNRAFERSTGYSAEEAIGRTPRILRSGEHDMSFYRDLWQTILSGDVWESEVINKRKDGRRQYIDQTIAPIFGEEGEIDRFVAVNTEITEKRRHRQQLQVLYRVLRHNLRNELNVISGYTDLLSTTGDRSGAAHSAASDRSADAVERISRSVDNLLQISVQAQRIENTFIESEQITEMQSIETVVRRAKREVLDDRSGVSVSASIPSSECRVNFELGTAVKELLTNAVEHNDSARPSVAVALDVDRRGSTSEATITVEDDGPGIPENERTVLEEGEESPLLHGSGLGLWLANWIVTELGGTVRLDENDPRGTVVTIAVPVTE
ncbi:PAS domain S-box protein [Halobellus sp. GM3]|uniref:PAS domain S-box protein n=1 Tax=Halobellus sp. GM3 TaxID=3458410 RepID=UPI00403DEAAB